MKKSSKHIICSIALLLRLVDGEGRVENWGWNSVEEYLTTGKQGRKIDSAVTSTTTTGKRKYRRRDWRNKTFDDLIDERVLKSSKRGSSSSSSASSYLTKSSKKSKRSYRPPIMHMIARPAPSPTPPPFTPTTPQPTPPPAELNDDGLDDDADDDDDDDTLGGTVEFPPGEVVYREEDTQYGIGVHTGAPQPTPPPSLHPLLRPLDHIDTRLAPSNNAPTDVPDPDATLKPTVYLYRHPNHHAAFQAESFVQEVGRNFDGPLGAETIQVHQANVIVPGNPTEIVSNGEAPHFSSSRPNCRSSLCSTRSKSNQNHYCCNPSQCQQEDVIYPVPSFRFGDWRTTVYTNLTMLYFADVFGYTEATWELPGTNPVEQRSFLDVPDPDLLVYMGVSPFQYDCWFNHYQSYSWDELECYGLADAYITLGWDADTWGTIHSARWTLRDEKKWDELSSREQDAARKVCYFPALWNGATLSDWKQDWTLDAIADSHDRTQHSNQSATEISIDETEPPTPMPLNAPSSTVSSPPSDDSNSMPSMAPTNQDSMAPSIHDSENPSMLPSVMASSSPSWIASESPSSVPSIEPTFPYNEDCLSSACSNRTTVNVGQFCCGTDTCDRKSIVLPIPTFRWQPWDGLDDLSLKAKARALGYTKDLWNHPGAYELERWSFGFLSEANQQSILELGFTPQTWDCWQNHYQDYSWEELTCYGLVWAAEALGWTEANWSNHDGPLLVLGQSSWSSLSYQERAAARELCYSPALWEHTPLDQWHE